VIKIEEPGKGDDTRSWPPFVGGESTYFMSVNRNKKSMTLNLKAPEAGRSSARWCARATCSSRTSGPARWTSSLRLQGTLAPEPKLVYCAISGFGESGPEAHRAGYDLIVQAESGVMT